MRRETAFGETGVCTSSFESTRPSGRLKITIDQPVGAAAERRPQFPLCFTRGRGVRDRVRNAERGDRLRTPCRHPHRQRRPVGRSQASIAFDHAAEIRGFNKHTAIDQQRWAV